MIPDFHYLGCVHVKLGGVLCLHRIAQMFEVLYMQYHLNPDRLVVSPEDRKTLEQHIMAWSSCGMCGTTSVASITKIINEVTGKLVDLVTHPDLEQGCVIVEIKNV